MKFCNSHFLETFNDSQVKTWSNSIDNFNCTGSWFNFMTKNDDVLRSLMDEIDFLHFYTFGF